MVTVIFKMSHLSLSGIKPLPHTNQSLYLKNILPIPIFIYSFWNACLFILSTVPELYLLMSPS